MEALAHDEAALRVRGASRSVGATARFRPLAMPHTKRRRRNTTGTAAPAGVASTSDSRASTTALPSTGDPRAPHAARIGEYHATLKRLAREEDLIERSRLQAQLDALGGLATYQQSSLHGADRQRGGADTARWLVDALNEHHEGTPIRMLDVGAIDGRAYVRFEHMHVTSIDLHPAAFRVLRLDVLECVSRCAGLSDPCSYPLPADDEERFDIVGLCLVLNFVGDLAARGAMLVHAARLLAPRGLLYLVLPAACVTNSRYLDHERLRQILASVGFDQVVRQNDTAKLSFWLVRRADELPERDALVAWRKTDVRHGVGSFNNVRRAVELVAEQSVLHPTRPSGVARLKSRCACCRVCAFCEALNHVPVSLIRDCADLHDQMFRRRMLSERPAQFNRRVWLVERAGALQLRRFRSSSAPLSRDSLRSDGAEMFRSKRGFASICCNLHLPISEGLGKRPR